MSRLLSANFARLKKDKVFWLGIIFMFLFGCIIILKNYFDMITYHEYIPKLDELFFGYSSLLCILSAVFCSLYLGTEYNDGTIRNKLVVGHSRSAVYLSSLILCIAAGLLMLFAYIIPVLCLGIPLVGFFTESVGTVLYFFLTSLLLLTALSAIFTLLSMLNQNHACATAVAVVGIFTLLMLTIYISGRLNEPPFYEWYEYTDNLGKRITEKAPNPTYLEGTARKIYEFFLDFLPTGQALQIGGMSASHLWAMPLYSLLITVTTTAAGLLTFGKKDIK